VCSDVHAFGYPWPIEAVQLDNGLRVVVSPDPSVSVVAVNLWYDVGSRHEPDGQTGFAHLFEHLMFEGSLHVAKSEHMRLIQGSGGSLNATTNPDRTNYFETVPAEHLELALWLEADRMGGLVPALTQETLDNQREVVKNERRQRYDNVPYGTAFERLLHLAYDPDYSYHWPTIGSMEDLGAASLDDVRDFFTTWYRPDNCTLTLVGDFAPSEARELVQQYFGDIPSGGAFPKFDLVREPLGGERRDVFRSPIQLPRLYRLYHLAGMGAPEWIHADLLSTILSGDKASRLEKALVLDKQIATDVAAYVLPTEAAGMLMLQATAKEGVSIETVEAAIDAEIDRIAAGGITEEELSRAKTRSEVEFAHQIENYDTRADVLGMMATYFGDSTVAQRWLEPYDAATAADIAKTTAERLGRDERVTIHFLPEAA
jgi:zinc protease